MISADVTDAGNDMMIKIPGPEGHFLWSTGSFLLSLQEDDDGNDDDRDYGADHHYGGIRTVDVDQHEPETVRYEAVTCLGDGWDVAVKVHDLTVFSYTAFNVTDFLTFSGTSPSHTVMTEPSSAYTDTEGISNSLQWNNLLYTTLSFIFHPSGVEAMMPSLISRENSWYSNMNRGVSCTASYR